MGTSRIIRWGATVDIADDVAQTTVYAATVASASDTLAQTICTDDDITEGDALSAKRVKADGAAVGMDVVGID